MYMIHVSTWCIARKEFAARGKDPLVYSGCGWNWIQSLWRIETASAHYPSSPFRLLWHFGWCKKILRLCPNLTRGKLQWHSTGCFMFFLNVFVCTGFAATSVPLRTAHIGVCSRRQAHPCSLEELHHPDRIDNQSCVRIHSELTMPLHHRRQP